MIYHNEITRLKADYEKLQNRTEMLENKVKELLAFKEYFDALYGQGLEVANWHLNGALEPFDNFYDRAVEEMDGGK